MKRKNTTGDDGSTIIERMEVDYNRERVGPIGKDGAEIDSALFQLKDYRTLSLNVLDVIGGGDNPFGDSPEDPFAPPAPVSAISETSPDEVVTANNASAPTETAGEADDMFAALPDEDPFMDTMSGHPETSVAREAMPEDMFADMPLVGESRNEPQGAGVSGKVVDTFPGPEDDDAREDFPGQASDPMGDTPFEVDNPFADDEIDNASQASVIDQNSADVEDAQDDVVSENDGKDDQPSETVADDDGDSFGSNLNDAFEKMKAENEKASEDVRVDDSFADLDDLSRAVPEDRGQPEPVDHLDSFFGNRMDIPSDEEKSDITDVFDDFLGRKEDFAGTPMTDVPTPDIEDEPEEDTGGFGDFFKEEAKARQDASWASDPSPFATDDHDPFGADSMPETGERHDETESGFLVAETVTSDEPADKSRKIRTVEIRKAPETPSEMPEGWKIGEPDPESSMAAAFSVGDMNDNDDDDEAAEETTEVVTASEKPAKKGFSMFGKKKSIKDTASAKVVTEKVSTIETGPEGTETRIETVTRTTPKRSRLKLALLSSVAALLLLGGGGYLAMQISEPTPQIRRGVDPLPAPNSLPPANPSASTPETDLGLPGQEPSPAANDVLGLPGEQVPAAMQPDQTAPVQATPGNPDPAAPDTGTGVQVEADRVLGDEGFIDGEGVMSSAKISAEIRADLDSLSLLVERQTTQIEELQDGLRQVTESLQLRDASFEAQDEKIAAANKSAEDALRVAEDQNAILVEFANTKADVAQNTNMSVDLSHRVNALEASGAVVEDLARQVAQMRRDMGAVARMSLGEAQGGRQIVQPSAPKVAPAPASGAVYGAGTVPLDLPQQVQVPAGVKIGDEVPGGGKVTDIMTMPNGKRLVVMEKAQVVID